MQKMWEKAAQERAAAEVNLRYVRQQMALETLAMIKEEEDYARLQEEIKMTFDRQERERHQARLEEEHDLELMKRKAELTKRQRSAEMSMRRIRAWQDMETAQRKEKELRSKKKSVSRPTTRRNDVRQDTRTAVRRHDEAEECDTDGNEMISEEQVNLETEPATSKDFSVSQIMKYSAKSDAPSCVSVQRPCATTMTEDVTLNEIKLAETNDQGLGMMSTSTRLTSKVNQHMNDLNFSPLAENVEDSQDITTMNQPATKDETQCEEQRDIVIEFVTSKNMIMTTKRNSFVANDSVTSVSVRHDSINAQATTTMMTSDQMAMVEKERMVTTSTDFTSAKEVYCYPSSVKLILAEQIEEIPISKLKIDVDTFELYKIPTCSLFEALADYQMLCMMWRTGQTLYKKLEMYSMGSPVFETESSEMNVRSRSAGYRDHGIRELNKDDIRSAHQNDFVYKNVMSVSDVPSDKLCTDQLNRLATGDGFRLQKWTTIDCDTLKAIELTIRDDATKEITGESRLHCKYTHVNFQRDESELNVDITMISTNQRKVLSAFAWLIVQVVSFMMIMTTMMMLLLLIREFSCLHFDHEGHDDIRKQLERRIDLSALKNDYLPQRLKTGYMRQRFPLDIEALCDSNVKGLADTMTMRRQKLCGTVLNAYLHEVFVGKRRMEIDNAHFAERHTGNHNSTGMYQCLFNEGVKSATSEVTGMNKKMIEEPSMFYGSDTGIAFGECEESEDQEQPNSNRESVRTILGNAKNIVELFNRCSMWTRRENVLILIICLVYILKMIKTTLPDCYTQTPLKETRHSTNELNQETFNEDDWNLLEENKVRKPNSLIGLKLLLECGYKTSLRGRLGGNDNLHQNMTMPFRIEELDRIDLTIDAVRYMINAYCMHSIDSRLTKTAITIMEKEWTTLIIHRDKETKLLRISWTKLKFYASHLVDVSKRFFVSKNAICVLLDREVLRLVTVVMSYGLIYPLERIQNVMTETTMMEMVVQWIVRFRQDTFVEVDLQTITITV